MRNTWSPIDHRLDYNYYQKCVQTEYYDEEVEENDEEGGDYQRVMAYSGVMNYGDMYFQKLIGLYAEQNGALSWTNRELAEEVRLMKKRQQNLRREMIKLEQHKQKLLLIKKQREFEQELDKQNINSKQLSHKLSKTTFSQTQAMDSHKVYGRRTSVDNLTRQFEALVTQSTRQQNPAKRKQMRRQLASIANEIKKMKEQSQDNLQNYLFNDQ